MLAILTLAAVPAFALSEPEAGADVEEMGANLAGAYDNMANGLASLLQ